MKQLYRVLAAVFAVCSIVLCIGITILFSYKVLSSSKGGRDHVAVVDINGVIYSASSFVKEVEELLEQKSVKAIVVRINSPGGLVAPSQDMFEVLKRADAKVPVVVSMGSLAASGGYYASLAGRKVFANPGTLTASIGVIMEFANTEKLYTWAKMERFSIKSGKFKDTGSPFRAMRPDERELLTGLVMDIYKQFRGEVGARRKLSEKELDVVADGRVVTGMQAKQAKLVDEIGGFHEAVKAAKEYAKLSDDAPVVEKEKKQGLLREMLFGDSDAGSSLDRIAAAVEHALPASSQVTYPGWKVMLLAPLH